MSILIKNKRKGGFSMIELLIVISIFTIITTVALFDQGRLNSNVLLTNLAYDVALTVREAQSYGVGVRYSAAGNDTLGGYGVYLDTTAQDQIVVFHDIDANGEYDSATEEVKTYKFLNQRGNQLAELCVGDTGNVLSTSPECSDYPSGKKANKTSITFKRPDPEANFRANGEVVSGPVYLVLKSQDGTNCRAVVIESSGQIRVEGSDSDVCKKTTTP